jgi:hypothetical protein
LKRKREDLNTEDTEEEHRGCREDHELWEKCWTEEDGEVSEYL